MYPSTSSNWSSFSAGLSAVYVRPSLTQSYVSCRLHDTRQVTTLTCDRPSSLSYQFVQYLYLQPGLGGRGHVKVA